MYIGFLQRENKNLALVTISKVAFSALTRTFSLACLYTENMKSGTMPGMMQAPSKLPFVCPNEQAYFYKIETG